MMSRTPRSPSQADNATAPVHRLSTITAGQIEVSRNGELDPEGYNFPYPFGLLFRLGLYARYREVGQRFVPDYEAFDATMQRLRALSRPEAHVYLGMIGVLPAHRRQGIATTLIEDGHAWADDLGLPVALDTDTEENVAFYTRRGYEVIARARLPDSHRELVAMRRRPPGDRLHD